jgi:cytochrome c oxidase subunit 2
MWNNLPLFPERASALAWQVDGLYFLLIAVSAFFTLLIFALIFVFAVKYRRSIHPHPVQIEGSLPLELTWTLIPLGICMIFFAWGSLIFFQEARPPKGAMEVYAVGKQWMWKFEHETGQREINQLHVPVGADVKMIMSSQDVIHSFYVPAFRVKQDVLPGRYTSLWFEPVRVGRYHLYCAEYCGTNHSTMGGWVTVMEPADFQSWLSQGGTGPSMAEEGERLFVQHHCAGCHRGSQTVSAPRLEGVYGRPVPIQEGRDVRFVTADSTYIRDSILRPKAQVVAGYEPVMPSFQDQISEPDLLKIIAYIKSIGVEGTTR